MTANPHTYKSRARFYLMQYISPVSTFYYYKLTPLCGYVQFVAVKTTSVFGVARTTTIYPCDKYGVVPDALPVVDSWQHMTNPVEALHQLGYEAVDIPETGEISVRR